MKVKLVVFFITVFNNLSASNIPPAPMGPEPPPGGNIGGIGVIVAIALIYGVLKKIEVSKRLTNRS